jgi:DNA-binding transcriptional LysR family regulator
MDHLDSMSWDDVRVFLSVAREGTVRRGAATIGSSHSTVLRRIGALEESLGVRLFHRRSDGYVLTPAGERARDISLVLEDRMHDIRRQVQGSDARLSGHVRVALPDAFLPLLLRALPRFEAAYPSIDLELVTSTRYADLHRGEADVAVRIAQAPDEDLVGRRVADVSVAVYGSKNYARRVGDRDVARLDWLGWERGASTAFGSWIDAHVKARQIRLRLGGVPDLEKAIDADVGVTLMPAALGDVRRTWHCFRRLKEMRTPVWVLSHVDLKTTARVRAVRDFIGDTLSARGDSVNDEG